MTWSKEDSNIQLCMVQVLNCFQDRTNLLDMATQLEWPQLGSKSLLDMHPHLNCCSHNDELLDNSTHLLFLQDNSIRWDKNQELNCSLHKSILQDTIA